MKSLLIFASFHLDTNDVVVALEDYKVISVFILQRTVPYNKSGFDDSRFSVHKLEIQLHRDNIARHRTTTYPDHK